MNAPRGTNRARVVRWPAILVLAGAVVVMAVVNGDAVGSDQPAELVDRPVVPVALESSSLSSTWYCAGGTIVEGGLADHELVLANPTDTIASVQLTVFAVLAPAPIVIDVENAEEIAEELVVSPPEAVDLGSVLAEVEVEPLSVLRTRVADLEGVQGENAAVLVESNVGSLVVEHVVTGAVGSSISPCASASANSWHFAAGTTRRGAREVLSLFNPFPGDAVVDLSFATDAGPRSPQIYDGLVVPSGSVLPVDITGVVTLFDSVSADINVRTGRLIVDRLLLLDGTDGPGGTSIALGSPEPAGIWVFASSAPAGATDAIVIHNPSTELEAEVAVEITLDLAEFNGTVEPVEVTIRPGRTETVVLGGSAELVSPSGVVDASGRMLADVGYWMAVRSFNGVEVVADHFTIATTSVPVATSASPGAIGRCNKPCAHNLRCHRRGRSGQSGAGPNRGARDVGRCRRSHFLTRPGRGLARQSARA